MFKIAMTISIAAISLQFSVCNASPLSLNCGSDAKELNLIRSRAKSVVSRKSKHDLRVTTSKGILKFIDQPPHDEPLSGIHYYFCDRKEGFILLRVEDESLFTGKLVNELTGKMTDAGQDVLFSDDRRAYFASEQPDGLDGERWNIHFIDGRLSWSGYNFILRSDKPDSIYAYLENPSWSAKGEFTATAYCTTAIDRKWKVKLIKVKDQWVWKPQKKCPVNE